MDVLVTHHYYFYHIHSQYILIQLLVIKLYEFLLIFFNKGGRK